MTKVDVPNSLLLDVTEKKIGEIVPHIKAGDQNIKQKISLTPLINSRINII